MESPCVVTVRGLQRLRDVALSTHGVEDGGDDNGSWPGQGGEGGFDDGDGGGGGGRDFNSG